MKKQIIKQIKESNVVELKDFDFSEDKFYGFKNGFCNTKGFVIQDQFENGVFRFVSTERLTNGNRFLTKAATLCELITTALSAYTEKPNEVFVFDTAQELFTWLAE